MYYEHWGLDRPPFPSCAKARHFFANPLHDEALARLHFLIDTQRPLGILTGPSGVGKTLLLEVLAAAAAPRGCPTARLSLLAAEPEDLLFELALAFGLAPQSPRASNELWRLVADRLIEYRWQGLQPVLLVDDVQGAAPDTLAQLLRVLRHAEAKQCALTAILALDSAGLQRLPRRLLDLAELRIDLEPWDGSTTAEYVEWSLRVGGRHAPVFTADALVRLQELTGGVPRHINQVADLALLAAAGLEQIRVEANTLEAAVTEMGSLSVG